MNFKTPLNYVIAPLALLRAVPYGDVGVDGVVVGGDRLGEVELPGGTVVPGPLQQLAAVRVRQEPVPRPERRLVDDDDLLADAVLDGDRPDEPVHLDVGRVVVQPQGLAHVVRELLLDLLEERSLEEQRLPLLRLPEVPPPLRLGPEDVGARGAVGEEHVVAGVPLVVAVVLGSNSIDNRLIGHLMIHNMQITLDIKFIS